MEDKDKGAVPQAAEGLMLKAAQCRRLCSTIADRQTVEALTALAAEYEHEARRIMMIVRA